MKNKLEALCGNQHGERRVHREKEQLCASSIPCSDASEEKQDGLSDSDVTALPLSQTLCTSGQTCLFPSLTWKAEKKSRTLGFLFSPGSISPAPTCIQKKAMGGWVGGS